RKTFMTSVQPITTCDAAASPYQNTNNPSRIRLWSGRGLTGLIGAFLLFDATMKLVKPPFVVEATVRLGYPESTIAGIGVLLLICTLLYLIPRSAVVGAVLLTGYLGGAIATHVRAEQPLFNIVFSAIFGGIIWAGLWLRDGDLLQRLAFRK